ncbi:MAG: hypothetical protein V1752_04260, partial [Candidatus Firestonebacteria bacterium]
GEMTSGYVIFVVVKNILVVLPAVIMFIAAIICTALFLPWAAVANFGKERSILIIIMIYCLPFIWIIISGIVYSVLNRIFSGALYVYASEGVIPEGFNKDLLDNAWQVK